jgi:hypothetical protein
MEGILKQHNEGSLVATVLVNFGAKSRSDPLPTGVDMAVNPMDEHDGKEVLPAYALSGALMSDLFSCRVPNLHRRGAVAITRIWVVTPMNTVIPKLMQKLHSGAVDVIKIMWLAFVDNDPNSNKMTVVQVIEYFSCFITCIDYLSWDPLAVLSFDPVGFKMTTTNHKQHSEGGKNAEDGRTIYGFDSNQGSGSQGT